MLSPLSLYWHGIPRASSVERLISLSFFLRFSQKTPLYFFHYNGAKKAKNWNEGSVLPLLSFKPRPSSLRSARPSWRGPGKTAGGSVRSQFSPLFTLTVARVPCYEMSRAYITGLQLVGFCEHCQSGAVLKKVSDRKAVGLHLQSNSRLYYVFEFRSHAFGVFSDHALVTFLFQWIHKKSWKRKADRRRPRRLNRLDGLLRKRSLRRVYGNLTCVRFSSWIWACLLKHAFAIHMGVVYQKKNFFFVHYPLHTCTDML